MIATSLPNLAAFVPRFATRPLAAVLAASAGCLITAAALAQTGPPITYPSNTSLVAGSINAAYAITSHDITVPTVSRQANGSVTVTLNLDKENDGTPEQYQLSLTPHSVRSPNYQLVLQEPNGRLKSVTPDLPRTYRGTVVNQPSSFVACSVLADDTVYARVVLKTSSNLFRNFWVEPVAGVFSNVPQGNAADHVVYIQTDIDGAESGGEDSVGVKDVQTLATAEIAFDVDAEYYQIYKKVTGTDAAARIEGARNVEAQVEMVLNMANVPYESQVGITHLLTATVVRALETGEVNRDPYGHLEAGTRKLSLERSWTSGNPIQSTPLLFHPADATRPTSVADQPHPIQRQFIQLLSGARSSGAIADGHAFCGPAALTKSALTSIMSPRPTRLARRVHLSAHELGHNWGAGTDPTNPCGATLNPHIGGPWIMNGTAYGYTRFASDMVTRLTTYRQKVYTDRPHRIPHYLYRRIFEGENAQLNGTTVQSSISDYRGTGYAAYQGNSTDYVEWTLTAINLAGSFVLDLRYRNEATVDQKMELKVNGTVKVASLSFPPTGTVWGHLRVPIVFARPNTSDRSRNVLRFTGASTSLKLDRLTVERYYMWPADVDLDGDADTADLNALMANFTGADPNPNPLKLWSEGDLDGDGDVDSADYSIYNIHYTGPLTFAATRPRTVSLMGSDLFANETGDSAQLFLHTEPAPSGSMNANLTVGGTATPATDYPAIASPVAINTDGVTALNIQNVSNDGVAEITETVAVTVASGTGYEPGHLKTLTTRIGSTTILNEINISPGDRYVAEPAVEMELTVTSSPPPSNPIVVTLARDSSSEAASTDYQLLDQGNNVLTDGKVTIGTSGTVTIRLQPVNDVSEELGGTEGGSQVILGEKLILSAQSGTGFAPGPYGTITTHILDDDAQGANRPTISVSKHAPIIHVGEQFLTVPNDASNPTRVPIRMGQFRFEANKLAAPATVSVQLSGTQVHGTDYVLEVAGSPVTVTNNQFSIPVGPNWAETYVDVVFLEDLQAESANETLATTITNGQSGSDPFVRHATAYQAQYGPYGLPGTVMDNELPTVTISASAVTVSESGAGGLPTTSTVTITGTPRPFGNLKDLTVQLGLSGSATAGSDYTLPNSILVRHDTGEGQAQLDAKADGISEGTEQATLTIQPSPDYLIGSPSSFQINIVD